MKGESGEIQPWLDCCNRPDRYWLWYIVKANCCWLLTKSTKLYSFGETCKREEIRSPKTIVFWYWSKLEFPIYLPFVCSKNKLPHEVRHMCQCVRLFHVFQLPANLGDTCCGFPLNLIKYIQILFDLVLILKTTLALTRINSLQMYVVCQLRGLMIWTQR